MREKAKDSLSNKQIIGALAIAWLQSSVFFIFAMIASSFFYEEISNLEAIVDLGISIFGGLAITMLVSLFTAFIPSYFLALIFERLALRKLWQYILGASAISLLPCLVLIYGNEISKLFVFLTAMITSYLLWKRVGNLRKSIVEKHTEKELE